MSITRNHVIAVLGGAVVLFAVVGLMEVQSRAGPVEEPLQQAALSLTVSGTLERSAAEGTTGPGGVCLPEPPATECRPAQTRLDLQIQGLPVLPPPAIYQVWLSDGAEQHHVGPLIQEGGLHRIDVNEEVDATVFTRISVTAGSSPDATGGPTVYASEIGSGSGTVPLADQTGWTMTNARGQVVLREIGGVAISTTADLTVSGLESYPGWTYRAWSIDHDGTATNFGPFDADPERPVTFDARVEHLRLEDQERFLIVLQPVGVGSESMVGIPVLQATLEQTVQGG